MRKEQGMTFLGLVIVLSAILSLVLAGVKIVPAYIEFMAVKKLIKKIADEPSLNEMSKADIADVFYKGATAGYITVVSPKDLKFSKDATGKTVVTIEYEVVKPLVGNLSALIDFHATTAK